MKRLLFIFSIVSLLLIPILKVNAAVATPIKILLVPGHDDEVWGSQYGNVKEGDMTVALATRIYNLLKADKRFEVHITRDSKGYTKEFADYFATNEKAIVDFKENAKKQMTDKITSGDFIEKVNPLHNSVSEDVAIKLYGFNKWANENKMDAVIHLHFNDYPRAQKWTIGKYSGFAVYMPDSEMSNWFESGQLAASIFTQLKKKYSPSNYIDEKGGLIPDQKLIALGSNGTLLPSVRSVLVEYGYIYEKKFRTGTARTASYKDMASRTVTGIKNYFFKK